MTLIPGFLLVNMCNVCIKIHQKSTKNPLLEPPWGPSGAILDLLGDQDAPKRRPRAPKRRPDHNFKANLTQLGSNLEAPDPLKSRPKPEKIDVENNTFLQSILKGFGPGFGRVFGRFFGPKRHVKSKNTILAKSLKIVLPSRRN